MQLAALTPLPETPAPDPIATRIIARLDHVYPFEAFTRVQAAQAVTAIAKKTDRSAAQPVDLPVPRFGADQTPSPTTIGDVTHRVMLHLDFSRACDAKDLEQQISEMVDRKLIAPSAAKRCPARRYPLAALHRSRFTSQGQRKRTSPRTPHPLRGFIQ